MLILNNNKTIKRSAITRTGQFAGTAKRNIFFRSRTIVKSWRVSIRTWHTHTHSTLSHNMRPEKKHLVNNHACAVACHWVSRRRGHAPRSLWASGLHAEVGSASVESWSGRVGTVADVSCRAAIHQSTVVQVAEFRSAVQSVGERSRDRWPSVRAGRPGDTQCRRWHTVGVRPHVGRHVAGRGADGRLGGEPRYETNQTPSSSDYDA